MTAYTTRDEKHNCSTCYFEECGKCNLRFSDYYQEEVSNRDFCKHHELSDMARLHYFELACKKIGVNIKNDDGSYKNFMSVTERSVGK